MIAARSGTDFTVASTNARMSRFETGDRQTTVTWMPYPIPCSSRTGPGGIVRPWMGFGAISRRRVATIGIPGIGGA
ncbi:MAG: hypothetical protein EBT47_10745 [Chloroflexi bacterium]|nr:hypothetical protein [Chloroflexota bacterium]